MKNSLLILAYNEEPYIYNLIKTYSSMFNEIIVVNDKSEDRTSDILLNLKNKYPNLEVINNKKNFGAGRSFEIGINQFRQSETDYLIKIDGDNQFSKKDVLKLIKINEVDQYDFIKCDRFWNEGIVGNIPVIRYVGNSIASILIKIATGNWRINDPLNGLFLMSKKSTENLKLPKFFHRYGYPYFLTIFMSRKVITENIRFGQFQNVVEYNDQKSGLNAYVLFYKLIYTTIKSFFMKIKMKLKYSELQSSSFIDIASIFSLIVSLFSFINFAFIRYGNKIGVQSSWFLTCLIFFLFFIFLFNRSQSIENSYFDKNFSKLNNDQQ